MQERKRYLDNLRALTVLLLFPYHVFMIYNNWGEPFYIHGAELSVTSAVNQILWLWMMPSLFTLAGISARYALQKRSAAQFVKERVDKLLLPLLFGMLLLIPIQSYLAGLFSNGHASYFDYFTTLTDFTGYDGAFTPGHLWFILFLFAISMISLPFMLLYRKRGKGTLGQGAPLFTLVLMGLLPCLGNVIFDISGKSPTEYLAYYLLGYFFLSNEEAAMKLEKHRFALLCAAALGAGASIHFDHMFFEAAAWLCVLAVLGMARRYLNYGGRVSAYLTRSSFGVYLFHQSWIVIAGYFILMLTGDYRGQIPLILACSIALTYATYEIARRIPLLRRMFALK